MHAASVCRPRGLLNTICLRQEDLWAGKYLLVVFLFLPHFVGLCHIALKSTIIRRICYINNKFNRVHSFNWTILMLPTGSPCTSRQQAKKLFNSPLFYYEHQQLLWQNPPLRHLSCSRAFVCIFARWTRMSSRSGKLVQTLPGFAYWGKCWNSSSLFPASWRRTLWAKREEGVGKADGKLLWVGSVPSPQAACFLVFLVW